MPQQLLPETFLNNTTHLYLPEVKARSMVLYALVLGAVVAAGVAAFFVAVNVSVSATGVVRSVAERTQIRPLVGGRVLATKVQENASVKAGDTLLTLAPDGIDERLRLCRHLQAERQQFMADLRWIIITTAGVLTDVTRYTPPHRSVRQSVCVRVCSVCLCLSVRVCVCSNRVFFYHFVHCMSRSLFSILYYEK